MYDASKLSNVITFTGPDMFPDSLSPGFWTRYCVGARFEGSSLLHSGSLKWTAL